MRISSKPRNASIESSAKASTIIIQDNISSIHSAREPRLSNLNLRFLETGHTSIRYSNSPQHGGREIRRLGNGADVAGLEFHFRRNTGVALRNACCGDHE